MRVIVLLLAAAGCSASPHPADAGGIGPSDPIILCESHEDCPPGTQCLLFPLLPQRVCRRTSLDATVPDAGVPDAGGTSCGGACYQLVATPRSWYAARDACEAMGAHLVTIGTTDEQAAVWEIAMPAGASVWIGGTDEGSEGAWRWTTGEPWNAQWATSPIAQPDNADLAQHCAELWPIAGGAWADDFCLSTLPFVCEFE